LPVQKRILKHIKQFIVHGAGNTVRISMEKWGTLKEVPHFYRLISSNFLLKDLFEEVTQ